VSTAAAKRAKARQRKPRARAKHRRRRLGVLLLVVVAATALVMTTMSPFVDKAVQEIALPLRHEDIIRQQARDKGLDASLIAAVIYAESRFRDQTSSAGARGLMQITPQTAAEIAQRSGGTQFEQGDLASPQINIAYGSWYLRWLIDRYGGNRALAVAAYNAGTGNVDKWIARDPQMELSEIPFPETRHYVQKVLSARGEYRAEYARELGL
jgi:soluble lytic murein transglycosylase